MTRRTASGRVKARHTSDEGCAMRKLLIGLVILVPIAIGGYFGAAFLANRWFESELEARFAALRSAGADASHGPVTFDLISRTLVVADIIVAQPGSFPFATKVGRVTATGVGLPTAGRLSADRIEVVDIEIERKPGSRGGGATYLAPRVELVGYSGPTVPVAVSAGASAADQMRASLEQLAAIRIASATVPTMTASVVPAAIGNNALLAGPVTVSYSDLALRDLRDRRIAGITVEQCDIQFPGTAGPGGLEKTGIGIAKLMLSDMDFGAILAALGPDAATDDRYYRAYGHVAAGPFTFTLENGRGVTLDSFTVDDMALNPSKQRLGELMTAVEAMQAAPMSVSPALTGELLDRVAGFYEGARIGKIEARGLTATGAPEGDVKLAAIRFAGLESGRLAEVAIEGLETRKPNQSFKVGRFAIAGLQVANAMRMGAQATLSNPKSQAEQIVDVLRLLEGVEVEELDVPDNAAGRYVVDSFKIGWGKFVGPIPTNARVTIAMTAPIGKDDPRLEPLAAAGITSAKLAYDMEAAWAEAGRTFSITPLVMDIENMFHASAMLSVGNVPRDIFSIDPAAFAMFSMGVEAGPIEFTLQDTGGLDLIVSLVAKKQGLSVSDARKAIIATVNEFAGPLVAQNGELKPLADAIAAFVETPKGTLGIKLVPKTRTPVMALFAEGQVDPVAVLSRFNVKADATR
jgi:hypothetical protein